MDRTIDFHGAKVALFNDGQLLIYRRDNDPNIPFPDMLDLPGGGRENGESGAECVARETQEEFGIRIDPDSLALVARYDNWRGEGLQALFYAGLLTNHQLENIIFGDEGQNWQMIEIEEFLANKEAVPHLQTRLRDYVQKNQAVSPPSRG
ncbi:hypothetical protein MNBD_ALPHA04-1087 [hydrothermal vent metagenome]|uniref:Nudix hydrolase domain-containing protein n=1 Tax=hydrothermal vent metagenome TaxID=652676 RepID=A0A3B0RDP3_9ZZZZ